MKNRLFKGIVSFFLVLCLLMGTAACSSVSTEPDEVAVHYSGGEFSSKNFENCVDASVRDRSGPSDKYYIYPKGQRTFSFTGKEGAESNPIAVTTGSQEVGIGGFVTFSLNTDCKALRAFHEKVGKKYQAYSEEPGQQGKGWVSFLNDYIAVPLDATLNRAAGAITIPAGESADQNWYRLYTNADTQREFEEYVKENLPAEIENTLGENFITVNAVSISKPQISDTLKSSLAKTEQARLENEAQKTKNEQVRTQFDTIQDCLAKGLSEQSCTIIYLSQSGSDIPFIPVPQGGNINVTP